MPKTSSGGWRYQDLKPVQGGGENILARCYVTNNFHTMKKMSQIYRTFNTIIQILKVSQQSKKLFSLEMPCKFVIP